MFKRGTGGCGGQSPPSGGTGGHEGCASVFSIILFYT